MQRQVRTQGKGQAGLNGQGGGGPLGLSTTISLASPKYPTLLLFYPTRPSLVQLLLSLSLTFSRARCDLWSSHFLQPFPERDRCDTCKETGLLSRRGEPFFLSWTEKWGPFEEGGGWTGWRQQGRAVGRHSWPPECWHKKGFGLVTVYLQLPLFSGSSLARVSSVRGRGATRRRPMATIPSSATMLHTAR